MQTAILVPREGLIVRDPASGNALREVGEKKPRAGYWLRRLRDGDVEEIDAAEHAKRKKKAEREAAANEQPAAEGGGAGE